METKSSKFQSKLASIRKQLVSSTLLEQFLYYTCRFLLFKQNYLNLSCNTNSFCYKKMFTKRKD